MKRFAIILAMLSLAPLTLALAQPQTAASAQAKLNVKRDIPYAEPADPRQKVDIYAPEGAKNLPVVFWIHGGGWQTGDKSDVQVKPQAFADMMRRLQRSDRAASQGGVLRRSWTVSGSFAIPRRDSCSPTTSAA